MFANQRQTLSAVLLLLPYCAVVTGQTINQVNSTSQPNQWNNAFGHRAEKQDSLWSGSGEPQSVSPPTIPMAPPQDAYSQYQQIGPTKVIHVGPATVQMGRSLPNPTRPGHNAGALSPEIVAQLTQYGAQTAASNTHLASANFGMNAYTSQDKTPLEPSKSIQPLPAPQKAKRGFGNRAADELQTAMRQLNPFTPRASRARKSPSPNQAIPLNRDLFSSANTTTQQVNSVRMPRPVKPQQPLIHQTGLSTTSHVSTNPKPSSSLFAPPPSVTTSITAEAMKPGFKSPPVIGTPLRVASNDGFNALPAPSVVGESPFGAMPETVPAPASSAPIQRMLPPPMRQSFQGHKQLPIQSSPVPQQGTPTIQPSLIPQPSPQNANGAPLAHRQMGQPNVQVVAPHTFSDSFTQQHAQRDINAFVNGSVNGFCPPSNARNCQPVIPVQNAGSSCGQAGCGSLCGCRPCSSPLWFQWESLLYYIDGYDTPALLTRSPQGTPAAEVGILGRATTETIFGDSSLGDGLRYGGRLTGGFWFDKCRKFGIQGEVFALTDGGDDDFRTRFGGTSNIGRPFFNEATGQQDAEILNMPGVSLGVFDANLSSRVYSAAPALRFNLKCCGNECDPCNPCATQTQSRFDFLIGYRYFHLGETLQLYERFEPDDGRFADGTTYEFFDEYRTRNDFHGIEFGFDWTRQKSRWYSQLNATVALGEVTRTTDINGFSTVVVPDAIDTEFPGGFYSSADEQGRTSDRSFAVLPQVRVKLGYCITPSLRVFAGYDVMYLSQVVRPGTLIDASLDPADLRSVQPAARRLTRDLPDDDFWMQGVSFGALWNF